MTYLIPNSTQIPDLILDRWLSELSGAEIKVVLYVARRTYGFRRESDAISLDQMSKGIVTRDGRRLDGGTGLSRETVAKTVAALEADGILSRQHHKDERGGNLPSTFSLNLACDFGVAVAPPRGVRKSDPIPDERADPPEGGGRNRHGGSQKIIPRRSRRGSENLTRGGGRKPDPLGCENLTHNIQGYDIQTLDIQVDRQQQQTQGAGTRGLSVSGSPDVVVPDEYVKNTNHEPPTLIEKLTEIGITHQVAEDLVISFPCRIEEQIAYLPHRAARNSAATLVRAIEGNWSVPQGYISAQEAAQRQKHEAQVKGDVLEARKAEKMELGKKKAKFEAAWQSLPHEKRGELERQVWKQLAQGGGPVAVRAKDILRGDLKPSEVMAGNAVRAIFTAALEKLVTLADILPGNQPHRIHNKEEQFVQTQFLVQPFQ